MNIKQSFDISIRDKFLHGEECLPGIKSTDISEFGRLVNGKIRETYFTDDSGAYHDTGLGQGCDLFLSHAPFFRVFGNDLSSFGIGRPMAPAGGAICQTAAVASGALVCGTECNLWCGRRMFREWESVPGVFVDTFIDFVLGKWR